jgi:hypothetical protein
MDSRDSDLSNLDSIAFGEESSTRISLPWGPPPPPSSQIESSDVDSSTPSSNATNAQRRTAGVGTIVYILHPLFKGTIAASRYGHVAIAKPPK